jgi:hypothetical protein
MISKIACLLQRSLCQETHTKTKDPLREIVAGRTGVAAATVGNDPFLSPRKDVLDSPVVVVSSSMAATLLSLWRC